jgi:hypothetical protein
MMKQEEVITALQNKLAMDSTWAIRALVRIAREQTDDEKVQDQTREHNGVGFRCCDAFILTRLAKAFNQYGRLTPKQLALVMRKVPVYARQLVRLTGVDPIRKALSK